MPIAQTFPDFTRARLLVVGDVMLDSYWHGAATRISPEAPVPVVQIQQEEHRVGGAGNVALNAASLGATVHLLGLVGQDPAADELDCRLRNHGVITYLMRVPGSKTISKLRVISRHQQLIRLDFEDHFPAWQPADLLIGYTQALAHSGLVILSDYAKGLLRETVTLIQAARRLNIPVVIDPKGEDFERYREATLITPNLAEFEAIVGPCPDEATLEERAENLRQHLAIDALLITRSERGMSLITAGNPPSHLPTVAREVFDVTGAGDTVVAVIGASLAAGLSLAQAVVLANQAAGLVVGKLGTATVSRQELEAQAGVVQSASRPAAIEPAVWQWRQQARNQRQRIVMTNGCFDILHPGHIQYLEQARALGDGLIVAINDDASVQRLKGSNRPINNLEHRQRMLAALACVDYVIPFAEDTPERLITQLLPDILVKGGDYRADQIAGAAAVLAAGGEVRVLEFLPGHSTTQLIDKIRDEANT